MKEYTDRCVTVWNILSSEKSIRRELKTEGMVTNDRPHASNSRLLCVLNGVDQLF